ncbi:hypothetical protein ElyMa_002821000 [Elysia marginata]|uniref:Uncharacterized protein n=1 Tax=Elysia marginata TaxID=1093978 RepID=A0AAV4HUS4_9GAST|nr:hypothetical protein ElyMa_002821000 [Elysia marginata]
MPLKLAYVPLVDGDTVSLPARHQTSPVGSVIGTDCEESSARSGLTLPAVAAAVSQGHTALSLLTCSVPSPVEVSALLCLPGWLSPRLSHTRGLWDCQTLCVFPAYLPPPVSS